MTGERNEDTQSDGKQKAQGDEYGGVWRQSKSKRLSQMLMVFYLKAELIHLYSDMPGITINTCTQRSTTPGNVLPKRIKI